MNKLLLVLIILLLKLVYIECFISSSLSMKFRRTLNNINMNNNDNAFPPRKEYKPRQQNNEYKDTSNGGSKEKDWQSGYIFSKNNSRPPGGKRRNDPWWMREEEKDNPRMLPSYKPWWLQKESINTDDMKVTQLKEEAIRRGLETSGLKADLIQRLNDSYKKFNLTDDCYTQPIYNKSDPKTLPPCYPDIYESANEIKRLQQADHNVAPPS